MKTGNNGTSQERRMDIPSGATKAIANPVSGPDKSAETSQNAEKVSFLGLYRFAGTPERLLILIGTIAALGAGVCQPMMGVIFGSATNKFGSQNSRPLDEIGTQCLRMLYMGVAALLLSAFSEACWTSAGERLGVKVRGIYLASILKKEISWFDVNRPQELPTKVASLITKYQAGIGEKVGKVIITISMFIAGVVLAFLYGWQLALVLLAIYPMLILSSHFMGVANSRGVEYSKKGYTKCGGYAEEALCAIRTVCAFCAETIEKTKYLNELDNAQSSMVSNAKYMGWAVGLISMSMALSKGVGYLVGSYFIQYKVHNDLYDESYNVSTVLAVFFAGMFAMLSLGMIAPQMRTIGESQMAAYDIFKLIDSVARSPEESAAEKQHEIIPPEKFKGRIEFHNVTFYYPMRPDVKVLNNFSMVFEEGKMTGICGETGSGKSTIIQLVERFYSPASGIITVDGVNISTLDLKWWRGMIGYVGQEPVLFNTTINLNIAYGREGVTQAEIEAAAEKANCTEYIQKLDKKYDTVTGLEGGQLSGGQKQRIAIARALVKRPKILLLDEATSALDAASERRVHEAFNNMQHQEGLTVLTVAHRLTTIQNADRIIVLHDGILKEQGTDKELRLQNTIYANLCRLQEVAADTEEQEQFDEPRKVSSRKKSSVHDKKIVEPIVEEVKLTPEQKAEKAKAAAELSKTFSKKLWSENWKHKKPMFFAIVLSTMAGFHMPIIGMLLGMISMDLQEQDESQLRRLIDLDFAGYMITGFAILIITFGMIAAFGYVAASVTHRLREQLYTHIFAMDVGWFDLPANLPSVLNGVLAEGTDNINGVVRLIVSTLIQTFSSLFIALGIGFAYSWKMSLIMLGCVPIMGSSAFIQTKFQAGFARMNEELYKASMSILSESVKNFRTVASFSSEPRILKMYNDSLEGPLKLSQRMAVISGVLFGLGQMIPFLMYAGLFYFAALFLDRYGDAPRDTFIAVYALLFAAMAIGQVQQHAPDMGKAYSSLLSVYGILSQESKVKNPEQPTENAIKGRVEFRNVSFKYPARNDYILKDFNLIIEPGQKVAVVGMSGSGKSTLVQLLERFYDVDKGEILLDGVDIRKYRLEDLRRAIGYVPQEPILFDTTIEENVKYGTPEATREQVVEACRVADAYDFITKDEVKHDEVLLTIDRPLETHKALNDEVDIGKGFERKVGAKGSLLSGGQKQRLAIARAVLKQPKIMLFDEATSALDSETEKLVQKALERVSVGRTSIVIAHKLGTIGDDDTIFVLENGKIVESGNKKTLNEKKGSFHKMYGSVMAGGKK